MLNTLLLVDDEPNILHALERVLNNNNYNILTATSGQKALELLKQYEVHVIISDQRMPQMSGSEFLSQVKKIYPNTVRMILTGHADFDAVKNAVNEGAIYKFLNKPWDANLLCQHVQEAFDIYHLEMKSKQASQVLENSLEAIMITNQEGMIQQINPAFTTTTGYAAQDIISTHWPIFSDDIRNPDSLQIKEALIATGKWQGEAWSQRKDKVAYPVWLSIIATYDEYKNIKQCTYSFLDITKQKENEQELLQLIYSDKLTGLHNRFFFIQHLTSAMTKAEKMHNILAILYINIDRFSHINNNFGRKAGDQLLQEVAKRLGAWVDNKDDVARLDNDEFIILLPLYPQDPSPIIQLQELLIKLREPILVNEQTIYLSISMGIALYPRHTDKPDLLIKYAYLALLHSKELGGNNYQLFSVEMEKQAPLLLENSLHQALDKQQFLLYYQPIIAINTGKIVGVEALLRWQHPSQGLLVPDQFIPLCETIGLIIPLGEWVLNEACQQLMLWHNMGYNTLTVAVNLSARQFNYPGLYQSIIKTLKDTKIPPTCLELEITESLIMQHVEANIALLKSLRNLSIRFSLDDFGTGYSSLSYLKQFPFSFLKIDKSFIHDINLTKNNDAIVAAIISMSKSLELTVIAEGVETPEQLALLKEKQCDLVQGYLYSKPILASELTKLLSSHRSLG